MTDTTEKITINKIPSPTWNWLKMNDAKLSYGGECFSSVAKCEATENVTKPEIRNLADGIIYVENAADTNSYDVTHDTRKLASLIETGAGISANEIFGSGYNSVSNSIFIVEKNCKVEKPVVINFDLRDGEKNVSAQIIHAKENADVTVIFVSRSEKSAAGFQALRTYCIAEKNAHIHLVKLQFLGSGYTQVDDTGITVGEGGLVHLAQVMLGSAECFTGAAATLAGYEASFKSDSAYLCKGEQKLDMNYVVRHKAKKTDCKMRVAGTLRDNAQKTYRGSIDFIKGCSGSSGEETEDVLLLSPSAVNKSIPLILCDEEDVAGEHGASIGRLGEDVLFYMQSRGVSRDEAENMIARAKVDAVLKLVPDVASVAEAENYL